MKNNNKKIRPFLKNDLFEGIIGKEEFLLLNENNMFDKINTVLISIHEPDSDFHSKEIVNGFKDVLQIKFWDIEEDFCNYKTITQEQGKEIFDFINKYKDSKFLIHCKAGMSRSAGVAMAVECIVNNNCNVYEYKTSRSDIKEFKRYFPNLFVFDTIFKNF